MSRLAAAFDGARRDGRAALIAYLMAGDPDLRTTEQLALACEAGGADVLELGIPFSDPIADGPEIQQAGHRALRAGTRPRGVLELAARLRGETELPIVLMTYVNPVLAMGIDRFAARAVASGADGAILPDVPLEASGEIRETFDKEGLDHIQLVAPSTPLERAADIGRASRGFLYVVARYGTTGVRSNLPDDLASRIRDLHRVTRLPLAVGFGVSTREQIHDVVVAGAEGVVVGSAIVRHVSEGPDPARVREFVRELASALVREAPATRILGGQGGQPVSESGAPLVPEK